MTEFRHERFDPTPLDIVPPLPGSLDRCCWYTTEEQTAVENADGSTTKAAVRCVLHDGHEGKCRWVRQ